MSQKPLSWTVFRLEVLERNIQDGPVYSCFLGQVFCPREGRNAWHSTWTEGGYDQDVSPTFTSAMYSINRKQGSTWAIGQFPAIVAVGKDNAVIITQIHWHGAESPFERYTNLPFEKATLFGVLESFRVPNPESSPVLGITCTLAKKDRLGNLCVVPAHLPFQRCYEKKDRNENTNWICKPYQVDLTYACEIIKRITQRLQEIPLETETAL